MAEVEIGDIEAAPEREDGFRDVRVGEAFAQVIVDGQESGVEEVGETSGKSQRAF